MTVGLISKDYKFRDGLGFKLSRSARILQRASDEALAEVGLTRYCWYVLASVAFDGKVAPTRIAKHVALERTAVSRMITQLENQGLVERKRSADDGRGNEIVATAAGAALCERVPQILQAALRPHVMALTPVQLHQLCALLDRISPADAAAWTDDQPSPPL